MNRTVSLLAMVSCVALLTACGGGGGGSGAPGGGGIITPPPVTPPPPPPPTGIGANDCVAKPSSLACSGTGTRIISGPTAFIFRNMSGNNVASALDGPQSDAYIGMTAGTPGTAGDETYNFRYMRNGQNEK